MKFTKMQGIGNDYIYLNCMQDEPANPNALARRISDRHFGVGSDGLVLICPAEDADFRMRMFNSDGSESEMCGNAARCIGKYVYERGLTRKTRFLMKTGAGLHTVSLKTEGDRVVSVSVTMGKPRLKPAEIPVKYPGEDARAVPVSLEKETMTAVCVNMGNPHAVFFVEDAASFPVTEIGPQIEHHPLFPERVNAEFVTVLDRKNLRMRVWERGAGETMACGTGACASLVAGVLTGRCEREAVLHLNGGDLTISWDPETGVVTQEGPAEFVFDGEYAVYGE